MAKYKLTVDQVACIGCAACTATCPDYFDMKDIDAGQKAKEKKSETEEFDPIKEAADICPVNAIHIEDEEGKRII